MRIFAKLLVVLGLKLPDRAPPDYPMPDPTIPWEVWPCVHPDMIRFTQGVQEYWLSFIWYPFWDSLDATQRINFLAKAPEDWREWILCKDGVWFEKWRAEHDGQSFDYKDYLEIFKLNFDHASKPPNAFDYKDYIENFQLEYYRAFRDSQALHSWCDWINNRND